ncbi:ionotropic receptor 21a [Anthonomus grandis grandis]|uniref:ionotropic receptor 21a n=1 Tax=Anthonomus grandis grandis TaxID=2921223 RepID=UPI0021650218|nr:ionotropic receptor 21a [Anthonomus grandis grandis]
MVKRALQKSHDKPRIQKVSENFLEDDFYLEDPNESLIDLLNSIAFKYLSGCTTGILYDYYSEEQDHVFLKKFFQRYRLPYVHASIPEDFRIQLDELFKANTNTCFHLLIFVKDVMKRPEVINKRKERVVIVSKSSQWRVHEYLSSEHSQGIPNLLVIVQSDKPMPNKQEHPYILYTHALYVDALGSSKPRILASWVHGNFSNNIDLYQPKIRHGFSGHRFIIAVAHQPPYVIRVYDIKFYVLHCRCFPRYYTILRVLQ